MPEMVAPRASRFLPQARRIVASGDENARPATGTSALRMLLRLTAVKCLGRVVRKPVNVNPGLNVN